METGNSRTESIVSRIPDHVLKVILSACAESERPVPCVDMLKRERADEVKAFVAVANEDGDPTSLNGFDSRHGESLSEMSEPSSIKDVGGNLGWLRLCQVCKLWRQIAHGYPELWAGELGSLPKAFEFMRAKAGLEAPITIRLYGSSYREDYMPITDFIRGDEGFRARIESFNLFETRRDHVSQLWASLCSVSFPNLRELTVCGNDYPFVGREDKPIYPTLHSSLLQRALLINVGTFIGSWNLSSLSLRTQDPPDKAEEPFVMCLKDLLDMLSACSRTLVMLDLSVRYTKSGNSTWTSPIVLSKLRTLRCYDPVAIPRHDALLKLFTFLQYPSSTVVDVELDCPADVAPQHARDLFQALTRAGSQEPNGLGIHVRMGQPPLHAFRLDLQWFSCASAGPANPDPKLSMKLKFRMGAELRPVVRLLLAEMPDDFLILLEFHGAYSGIEADALAVLDGVRWIHYYDEKEYLFEQRFLPYKPSS